MALDESTFILRSDLATADVENIAADFEKIITDKKGKVVKKELWGLRDLAYKINKSKKGHYFHLGYDVSSEAIDELRRKAKLSEDVVRDLTLKVEEISDEPTKFSEEK